MEFDEILNHEATIYQTASQEGKAFVLKNAFDEGYTFGVAKGKQISEEIGQIHGYVEFYFKFTKECTDNKFSESFYKTLKSLRKLISTVELDASKNEFSDKYMDIKSKYKLLQLKAGKVVKTNNEEQYNF
jgi:hypothetical protein